MIVTIHQPEHLPWLGFFDKVSRADTVVLLDHVQFRKNYFQNRNRIRTARGSIWITVPVLTRGSAHQAINEVQINNEGSPRWREKYWTSLVQSYRKTSWWPRYGHLFQRIYETHWTRLVDLNEALILTLAEAFSIKTKMMKSSDMKVAGQKDELLLSICKEVGASVYLSGVSGKEYLTVEQFASAGIKVEFQEFHHPIYRQAYESFIPCMSAIDLLFNYGPKSFEVIKGVGVETMSHVFE